MEYVGSFYQHTLTSTDTFLNDEVSIELDGFSTEHLITSDGEEHVQR
jgi:hypothetical protein